MKIGRQKSAYGTIKEHVVRWRNWLPYKTLFTTSLHYFWWIWDSTVDRTGKYDVTHDYDTSKELSLMYLQDAQNLFNDICSMGNWQNCNQSVDGRSL
jgi:hypothetical protein